MNTAGDVQQSVIKFVCSLVLKDRDDLCFRPILLSLLYTMVTSEKQFFPLRISILYCFECYLYKNDYGKSTVVQTLLPQSETG